MKAALVRGMLRTTTPTVIAAGVVLSCLRVANHYFIHENRRLGSLATDGGPPYAFPPLKICPCCTDLHQFL
jgi:hypothetical protein